MPQKKVAAVALLTTVVIWGGLAVIARSVVSVFPPLIILFIRMLVGSICFFPFFIYSKVWRKKEFKNLLKICIFPTINVTLYMIGVAYTSASASQLIYAAIPILIIVSGHIFRKEKYSLSQYAGICIGFGGLFYILYRSSVEKGTTITGGLFGNLLIGVAMLAWTLWILKSKKIANYFTPIEVGATSSLFSLAIATVLLGFELIVHRPNIIITSSLILSGLYMGGAGTFLALILYQYSVSKVSSLTVSITSYIQPIVTTSLAGIFLSERLNLSFLIGGVLVLSGVFVTQIHFLKRYLDRR